MKNSFLLVLLLLVGGAVSAQSKVYMMSNELSDTSIVRRWTDDKFIVYSSHGSSAGELICYDSSASMAIKAVVPSGARINDMRIANDTLYACGWVGSGMNKTGIIACLDINDFINGGGVFHAIRFQSFDLRRAYSCQTDLVGFIGK